VRACGERDDQPWVDARARVAAADVALRRPRTPPGRQVRVGAMPRPAGSFQDRDVAAGLREAAEQDGTVVLTQVVAGMGGVGKTQLAAAHARQAWRDGAGLVAWVNASSRDAVVAAYADAALALGLPGADREDPERSAAAFLAWAETVTDRWWLVVLDDVHRPGDLIGLWPPTAESAAAGQVLVTTRLREAALAGAGRRTVEVSVFTPQEARAYLQAQLGDRAPQEVADALAGALGMLPIALAQAAAYIRNADITIGRYLDLLATHLLRDVVPEPGHLTDDHQWIVTATWELSIDQASQARPAGLARPLLQLASVLDPAGIPQQALSSPPALEYLTSYLPESKQEQEVSPETVDEALRVLHRYSLIDHDRAAAHREVRVHQLVQRATRENLASQPGLGPEMHAALAETAADALVAVWPSNEGDQLGQIMRANTAALHRSTGKALWQWNGEAHPVLFHALTTLGQSGQVSAAATEYAQLLAVAVQRLGSDHADTLTAAGNLALWRARAGDIAGAVDVLEPLLDNCLRVLGPDHSITLETRGNLADCTAEAGDLAHALPMLDAVLADCVRQWGPFDRRSLEALSSLAHYQGEAGDVAGALASSERLLSMRSTALGPDDPQTLVARNHVANWRGESGDAPGAAAAFEQLVSDCSRVLGSDHPDTLTARNQLARWRGAAGNPAEAVAALESLLTDAERVLGPDHPGVLATRGELAWWQGKAGDTAGAIAALENLFIDRLRVFGPDHPHIQKTQEALEYWRRVLDSHE
jgi:NB-ARC domain/Tetratricopeptide repeat